MTRYCILLVWALTFASCGKKTGGEDGPGGSATLNFSLLGQAGESAAITTWFTSNRKGNMFVITIIDKDNKRQTYAGNGTKWELLGTFQATTAAISETGVVVYIDGSNTFKRYTGTGSPEPIAIGSIIYPKVVAGMDGSFYAGSANGKIFKSADDGKTWTATDIPQNRFNYSGNLAVGFLVRPDGRMHAYTGGGKFYQSVDAGKTWTENNITVNYANTGYHDIYSPVSHDHNGYVYIQGVAGVSIVNTADMSSRSVAFQSAALPESETFSAFATDAQGNLYGGTTNHGMDYEFRKQGAAIHKLAGTSWQKLPLPAPLTGFSAMNLQATQAGIISVANGLQSKGLYAMDASGKYTDLGTPLTIGNVILNMAPHTNGKVYVAMRHGTPVGTTLGAVLNPAYPVLMVLENGQWKNTGKPSDGVFVASNGNIYSIYSVDVSVSKDDGTSWQTGIIKVDDPLNLRNFLAATPLHFTELKGEIHVYFRAGFGGVGGAYANYSWTKAPLGSAAFENLSGKASNYDPASSRIPLTTAAKGTTGFFYDPFNGYVYYPARDEAIHLTKDGGTSYTPAGNILPFAGSNSGHYIAYGPGSFMKSGPGNPLSFSAIQLKLPEGEIDMNLYNGENYFKTWGRFGLDNKLYLWLGDKMYMSGEVVK